jgi:uncharacterized protein YjaG (DUF416 family)
LAVPLPSNKPNEEGQMRDADIVSQIHELVQQEHSLERSHRGEELSEEELEQLRRIEETLDQCWDLLRQRRARREYGQDPDEAEVRPKSVVEGYRQ